jgi:hypothetical protein
VDREVKAADGISAVGRACRARFPRILRPALIWRTLENPRIIPAYHPLQIRNRAMDRLDHLWTYATKRHVVWHLATFIAVFGVGCLENRTAIATPITLAFDAIVGPPRQRFDALVPPDWSISLLPGDKISGTFTFNPIDAPSNVHQTSAVESLPFKIQIKSKSLASSVYSIDVADNSNPIDSNGPYDNIMLACYRAAEPYALRPPYHPWRGYNGARRSRYMAAHRFLTGLIFRLGQIRGSSSRGTTRCSYQ